MMNKERLLEIQKELPKDVTLIAVSKMHTKAEIDEAYALGCTIFAENKVQEMKEKYDPAYTWHMIGHLQRNKVKDVVSMASMIQSLDSIRLAEEIDKQCAKTDKIMPVLVEINISEEPAKSGILLEEAENFIEACMHYEHLDVQGLMCVGPLCDDEKNIEACFEKMHILYKKLQTIYGTEKIHCLSMGMSDDYQLALKHGSTMVRLGSCIFGKRNYQ